MSGPTGNCPSCGAPIAFRWAGAVQTTCGFCDSILVRHGTDLEKVGTVSEPPPDTSRIQLGSEGSYQGRPFTVVGRIVYGYGRGGWSEWHIVFDDGGSGWLSDAMDEYAVTFQSDPPETVPAASDVRPGMPIAAAGITFIVTDTTPARYVSTEGELPFEYWEREDMTFADMKGEEAVMATLDYSEDPPLFFLGEYVTLESLRMSGLRDPDVTADAGDVRTLNCPNCGGTVTVRRSGMSVNVVCGSCSSVLDATSPGADVLQRVQGAIKVEPLIPLGSTGRWKGAEYEVLGFQVRSMTEEGMRYDWREYLLHNPEQGFRYLTEENGHWNDVVVLKSVPSRVRGGSHKRVKLHGEVFKHFEAAVTTTDYVLGEWPWQVRVGDLVNASDYVSPPRMLSRERTEDEIVWSLGQYVPGDLIWRAFDLDGAPPEPHGVYANQPYVHAGKTRAMWSTFLVLLLLLFGGWGLRAVFTDSEPVLSAARTFAPGTGDAVAVLGPFTLDGRPSNVMVEARTDLSNAWIYFGYALMNTATGEVRTFGQEVSYYFGRDSDGSWSEGSQRGKVYVPSVPAGEYMLRVEPEGQARVNYVLVLKRDVPPGSFYLATLVFLLLPPLAVSVRQGAFEQRRWAESDYADDDD